MSNINKTAKTIETSKPKNNDLFTPCFGIKYNKDII